MIIVSGRIHVRPGTHDEFLRLSAEAIVQARATAGCRDFVVSFAAKAPTETYRP